MASMLTKWLAHGAVHHSLPLSLSPRRRANTRTHEHGRRRHHHTQKQIRHTLLNMSKKKQHDKRAPTWRTFIRSRPFASCLFVYLAASSTRHVTWRGESAQTGSGEVFFCAMRQHFCVHFRIVGARSRSGLGIGAALSATVVRASPDAKDRYGLCCQQSAGWRLFMERLEDIVPDHEDPVRQVLVSAASAMAPVMNGLRSFSTRDFDDSGTAGRGTGPARQSR